MELATVCAFLGAGLAIGLGAIGSAIGEGYIAMKAVEALVNSQKVVTKFYEP